MNNYYWNTGIGNTTTILTTGAATTVPYYQPTYQVYYGPVAENAVLPDTPESWLRRRVKEVCDLAVAA